MKSIKSQYTQKFDWGAGSTATFFSFTCIFYICIVSYYSGIEDFWFSIKDFITPLVVVSLATCFLVYVLCVWNAKIFIPLLWGISFGAYLQLNFLNADYGLIDGHSIEWSSYGLYGIFNMCIWIFLIIALIVWYNRSSVSKKALCYASIILCIMQLAGLIGEIVIANPRNNDLVLTENGINEIGDAENLVMIILDTFDVRHAKYLLDTDHPICEELDGFTFYENAVSPYPKTMTSVPFMLTASLYKNESNYEKFLIEQYPKSELINQLYDNNYDIGLYTETDTSVSVLENKVSNLQYVSPKQLHPSSRWRLWGQLMRYSLFREVPHSFKKYITISINDFNSLKSRSNDTTATQYITDDVAYYQNLKTDGLTVKNGLSTFRLIHLNGMHEPLTLDSSANMVKESTVYEQLNGVTLILSEYLNALRAAGVYDQTAIMVLGDHGAVLGNQPALLYKPIGVNGKLQVSDAAVYYEDIHKTLLNEIGLDVEYGENITTLATSSRERLYYDYRIEDSAQDGYFPNMWEAIYTEDNSSFTFTGNIYLPQKKINYLEYAKAIKTGIEISSEDMRNYFNSNFLSWGEKNYIWGKGLESIMLFRLETVPNSDVSVILNFIPWIDSESKSLVVTLMDGTQIYDQTYYNGKGDPNFTFTISADAFDDSGAIALRMLWDDDSSALTENDSDLRQKQVGLISFQVDINE